MSIVSGPLLGAILGGFISSGINKGYDFLFDQDIKISEFGFILILYN